MRGTYIMVTAADISFVYLGIRIEHLRNSISVFGSLITFYGMIIGLGMLAGIRVARSDVKRRGQNPEDYLGFALYAIIFSIIGARLYYVAFVWDNYKGDPLRILNLRVGGLAIYGGVIAVVITLIVYIRMKKLSFFTMTDSGCLGFVTGQIIGCWGSFFNCEAFGGYTDSLLATRLKRFLVNESMIPSDLINHLIMESGIEHIQAHPIFLCESVWNLGILVFMPWHRHRKKFEGEMVLIYLFGYGFDRAQAEGLHTDQLIFFNTGVPVSQASSLILVLVLGAILLWNHRKIKRSTKGG